MSLLDRQARGNAAPIITVGLVSLAFLIVSVKYVSPMLYYISERMAGRPLADVPVMWDFWWPVYLLVAAQVHGKMRRAWILFLTLGVARVLWSAVVLTLFFAKPDWDFWGLQWLLYEVIVLLGMTAGIVLALTPASREEMVGHARGGSLLA